MRKDKYSSYQALVRSEREGKDFSIRYAAGTDTSTIIIAPHGGRIERRTSTIARRIAGAEFNFYAFEGKKRKDNFELH